MAVATVPARCRQLGDTLARKEQFGACSWKGSGLAARNVRMVLDRDTNPLTIFGAGKSNRHKLPRADPFDQSFRNTSKPYRSESILVGTTRTSSVTDNVNT